MVFSPIIQAVEDNIRESRSVVVEAINRMTNAGVIAINTNDDFQGVRLEASDGEILKLHLIQLMTQFFQLELDLSKEFIRVFIH